MRAFPRLLTGPAALTLLLTIPPAVTAQPQVRPDILTLSAGGAGSLTALREANALVDQLSRDGTLRRSRQDSDRLIGDRTHDRYQQFHEGVPVFGAEVTRQTSRGLSVSVFGTIHLGIDIDTTPGLTPFAATSIIEELSGTTTPGASQPRLVVLPDRTRSGIYRLAYEARAFTGTRLMVYFIDATTGTLVWSYNDLKTQQSTLPCPQCAIVEGLGVKGDRKKMSVTTVGGAFLAHDQLRPADVYTFDMDGDVTRTLDVLAGTSQLFDADLAMNPDTHWLDGASTDAHVGMGWTYDYLFHRFGRMGLNDENVRIISLVHPIDREAASTAPPELVSLFHLNAFYCGLCGPDGVGVAVFGEGLPQDLLSNGRRFNYFSGALDIVAHELAHAVTDFTSALLYVDESGALNEAFSDFIGVGAEFYAEALFRDGAGVAELGRRVQPALDRRGGVDHAAGRDQLARLRRQPQLLRLVDAVLVRRARPVDGVGEGLRGQVHDKLPGLADVAQRVLLAHRREREDRRVRARDREERVRGQVAPALRVDRADPGDGSGDDEGGHQPVRLDPLVAHDQAGAQAHGARVATSMTAR